MRSFALLSVAALLGSATAQRMTTTDWDADPINGVTAVVTIATDADGDPTLTRTLSTLRGTGTTTETTATPVDEVPQVPTPTTTQNHRIDAPPTTTYPPMTATTYNVDGVEYTWRNSFVSPDAVTKEVPAGTIQPYEDYQSSINEEASANPETYQTMGANGKTSAGVPNIISWNAMAGWTTMLLGAAGAGYAVMVL